MYSILILNNILIYLIVSLSVVCPLLFVSFCVLCLFECGVLFCVMCVICVLCLIVVHCHRVETHSQFK
jgi:hypothetical protein